MTFMDEIDQTIITLLQQNARRTNRDIARATNVAPSTVAARIQRLERDGIIAGYRATIRTAPIGLVIWAFIDLLDASKRADAVAFLRKKQETEIVDETFGSFDLIFRVHCRDHRHWAHLQAELVSSLAPLGRVRGGLVVSEAVSESTPR